MSGRRPCLARSKATVSGAGSASRRSPGRTAVAFLAQSRRRRPGGPRRPRWARQGCLRIPLRAPGSLGRRTRRVARRRAVRREPEHGRRPGARRRDRRCLALGLGHAPGDPAARPCFKLSMFRDRDDIGPRDARVRANWLVPPGPRTRATCPSAARSKWHSGTAAGITVPRRSPRDARPHMSPERLREVAEHPALAEQWRTPLLRRLEYLAAR